MPDTKRLHLLSVKRSEAEALKRNLGSSVGSTGLSSGAILGIAISAAVLLLIILLSVFINHARRKDRLERQRIAHEIRTVEEDIRAVEEEIRAKTASKPTRRPEINHPRKPLPVIVNPLRDADYAGPDPLQKSPMTKTRRGLDHKGIFRMSGMRDSWPLVSNIPSAFLPTQSTMTLNQVAPPGYVVAPESKWPRRSSTRASRNRVSVPAQESFSEPQPMEPQPKTPSPEKRNRQRRSTSETQLSTILRSTSQRLKAAQRQSLTRSLTTFTRLPGSPPKVRLPTPPNGRRTMSREGLIEKCYPEPLFGHIYQPYRPQTPPSDKYGIEYCTDSATKSEKLPTPSDASDDSLCGTGKRDSVIPQALSSPSKQSKKLQKNYRMSISPKGARDISMTAQKNRRSLTLPPRSQRSSQEMHYRFPSHNPISLFNDPFYSAVKSSRPVLPKTDLIGPRPLRVRKATFGQEATMGRPLSYTSPLCDVSGNAQHPHRRTESQPNWQTMTNPERNPFQWAPEDVQMGPAQLSPKRTGSRRKGHKRSNSIRMSILSRPKSTLSVDVVLEESEEDSMAFRSDKRPIGEAARTKSPTPSPLSPSRRHSLRPPTAATFNPSFTVPTLIIKPTSKPDLMQLDDALDSTIHSARNYYSQTLDSSETPSKSEVPSTLTLKARRYGHNFTAEQAFKTWELEKLISFPPPIKFPKSSLPERPSSSRSSAISLLQSPLPAPAPPLLAIPIPGHLTGPRSERPKSHSERPKSSQGSCSPAPRGSLHNSICMLRRMNSEVSHYSTRSPGTDGSPVQSPKLQFDNPRISAIQAEITHERGRTRGSKHYLSIGQTPPGSSRTRDSHHIYKDRQRRRLIQENAVPETNELASVEESTSFPTEQSALGIMNLPFPKLSSLETTGISTPNTGDNITLSKERRRIVGMEHLSPETPTKWGSGKKCLVSAVLAGEATQMSSGNRNSGGHSRAGSVGLYDEDGFLKSSPSAKHRHAYYPLKSTPVLLPRNWGSQRLELGLRPPPPSDLIVIFHPGYHSSRLGCNTQKAKQEAIKDPTIKMPRIRLEDSQELLQQAGEGVVGGAKKMWEGFTDFALQDNVLEVAVGLIIAAAFTTVVTSFVSEILLPPLSLLPFVHRNLDEKFAVLRPGPHYNKTLGWGYNTLDQATADGAVVMAYGAFINKLVNFVGVGFALYVVAALYDRFGGSDPIVKHTVKCKYCRKRINYKAFRCVNCTSWQDGREEHTQ
ncbi:uncharacterized protein BP5553_03016 [Venustampulla echinocandica]|uniref:Ion channel n=1 Tax=Venustampulla echinocandica TaxID=2656787 RepID=A0A370TT12_9HELO|nr:uncharacterized protein BP5553_03016 [Venustampulla echinocandica]RDL38676.1 hypothetical protein BP5553_03016 [Venustampulla echinocandica]